MSLLLVGVEGGVDFLAAIFYLLADAIVFAFGLSQVAIDAVSLLLELDGVVCMLFPQLLAADSQEFERLGETGDQVVGKAFVFSSSALEGGKLDSPGGHGSTLQRARSGDRSIADTQAAGLLGLLLEVFLGQRVEFGAIFLLNDAAFTVELLDFIEPFYAIGDLWWLLGSRSILVEGMLHTQAFAGLKPSYGTQS